MDEAAQALAYAKADFAEPHERFVDGFATCFPDVTPRGTYLDLGCGPGDVTLRFARRHPQVLLHGVDGAAAMLAHGHELIQQAGMAHRVRLIHQLLPADSLPNDRYDGVISNSLLHHLHDPRGMWQTVARFAAPGAPIFIMDLRRPDTPDQARALVEEYSVGEPEILRRDFYNSLLAAFRPEEVEAQLRAAALDLEVKIASDRHLIVCGTLRPAPETPQGKRKSHA